MLQASVSTAPVVRKSHRRSWHQAQRTREAQEDAARKPDTATYHAVGYLDAGDRFVTWDVQLTEEAAAAEAWEEDGTRRLTGIFPGSRFVVLTIDRPQGWQPAHFLDVPEVRDGDWLATFSNRDVMGRREILTAVTSTNRVLGLDGKQWSVILELGDPLYLDAERVFEIRDGVGLERTPQYRPVRIVRPTSEEIARAGALPLTSERG